MAHLQQKAVTDSVAAFWFSKTTPSPIGTVNQLAQAINDLIQIVEFAFLSDIVDNIALYLSAIIHYYKSIKPTPVGGINIC